MADKTGISWTDATWNPIVGCSVVSPGCTNCYAMRDAARIIRCSNGAGRTSHYEGTIQPSKAGPVWTGKVARAPDHILTQPLRWRRPRRIFVNSMGDLFHESIPDEWIDRVFAVMALAPQHTFQVLTKRSDRMRDYLTSRSALDERGNPAEQIRAAMTALAATPSRREMAPALKAIPLGKYCAKIAWPLPNVWLGVTAEDQARADERIPDLLATPAALRWVSIEPMLGAVDLGKATGLPVYWEGTGMIELTSWGKPIGSRPGLGWVKHSGNMQAWLDWVVCGGESGPHARPMHPSWARSLRDQCKAAGVPFHFKQWGEWAPIDEPASEIQEDRELRGTGACFDGAHFHRVGKARAGHLLDGVEHREFPGVRNV